MSSRIRETDQTTVAEMDMEQQAPCIADGSTEYRAKGGDRLPLQMALGHEGRFRSAIWQKAGPTG